MSESAAENVNKVSYNKIAPVWATTREKSFVSKLVVDFADRIVPKGNILDIGCGSGYLTKFLCENNFRVTGIDISEKMIEISRSQKIAGAEFIACDFFDFVPSQTYDGLLAWDSFFHFPLKRQKDIYARLASLLNSGGYLLFTHGNAQDEHIDDMWGEPFYYSCLQKEEMLKLLSENGFTIEYAHEDYREQNSDRALIILARKK